MTNLLDYINNDIKPLKSTDTIFDVQAFFENYEVSHIPWVEEGVYLGCISAEDVETFDTEKTLNEYKYVLEGFFVRDSMVLIDVLEVFAQNNTTVAPILNEDNKYLGYYEIDDIIKQLTNTPFLKEQGETIIVQKEYKAYSFSQIVQIIETNGGNLLGCFISEINNNKVQINIKTTAGPINDIIQTFRRYEYEIISKHHQDNFLKNLKERSDYLDKYLNI